jgi:diguanylate cyclase (GGDEF)-like protein
MNTLTEVSKPASQKDPKYLARFITAQNICFAIAGSIATIVLVGWLVPVVGSALPEGWSLMKANTALVILLSCASLILTQPQHGITAFRTGYSCGLMVFVLAGATLFGHLAGQSLWLDTLVAEDIGAEMPGRMSLQTAIYFMLLSITLVFRRRQQSKNHFLDAVTIALIIMVLMIFSGYLFGALHLFGHSAETRTSPHTLISMVLLLLASVVSRLRSDFFSIFVGIGIGSHIARISIPWTIGLPFIIISIGAFSMTQGWLPLSYAAALTATTTSILLFTVVLWLARKINTLEMDLRDKSLTDELTGVHNRRGLYLIGEHMLLEANREKTSLTVLYFDLDGLKAVNDTLGHDVGSELLLDFAKLLRNHFRHNDEVARIGGDEFAVLIKDGQTDILLQRLMEETVRVNEAENKPYRISYSMGQVSSDPKKRETLSDLVARADADMYAQKRQKKSSHEENIR